MNFWIIAAKRTGRGGGQLQILGVKQLVGTEELPVRIGDAEREPKTIRFEGYRKEPATGLPTFLFRVDGVAIEQRVLSFGSDQVTIELHFPDGQPSTLLLQNGSCGSDFPLM